MIRTPLMALVLLAACASTEDRCIRAATEDLRVINDLIAETEENISRGYALETEEVPRVGLSVCTGDRGSFLFCSGTSNRVRERPVALDLAEEQRKLDSLLTKRAELEVQARREISACEAAG